MRVGRNREIHTPTRTKPQSQHKALAMLDQLQMCFVCSFFLILISLLIWLPSVQNI